jgi:hypothetical protein
MNPPHQADRGSPEVNKQVTGKPVGLNADDDQITNPIAQTACMRKIKFFESNRTNAERVRAQDALKIP